MKKRLLTLGALALIASFADAQVVYEGDKAKFYVSTNALVYSGGNWMVNSAVEKTVENKGNIIIKGDYIKGSSANAATDGKEFVNVYTGVQDYGQVKLLNATGASNARMTVERPAASSNYFGASYAVSFPFQDAVNYLMKSFGKAESEFRGTCAVGTTCGNRYKMTLTKWNNKKIEHDAVPTSEKFKPGDYYNLNLREADMQAAMNKATIGYKGTPDGRSYSQTAQASIKGMESSAFSELAYNDWKGKVNSYNEKYESYMGNVSTTSKVYNKNVYRFGNPYTSNLDLSDFDGSKGAWLKILNNGERTIYQAHNLKYIKDFSVSKRMPDYDVDWSMGKGGSNGNPKYYAAKFDGRQWVGSAEALLIRPLETFNLNFPVLDPTKLGSRVLNVKVEFNDSHKTFEHSPIAKTTTSTNLTRFRTAGAGNTITDFYQLEVLLLQNNAIQSSPAYIVGSRSYKESGSNASSNDKVFAYGVKDNEIAYNSKKQFNEFNVNTYVGKPLGIGFNDLQNGVSYQLKFNLYEGSIFNKVDNLSNGVFYLKDNSTNKIVQIKGNEVVNFVGDTDVAKRFVVYWKQAPQISTPVVPEKLTEEVVEAKPTTVAYKEGGLNKIRFENIGNTVKVEVFNVSGRLVSSNDGIPTNNDYAITSLRNEGVYIVRVVYQTGEVRTLKIVNN